MSDNEAQVALDWARDMGDPAYNLDIPEEDKRQFRALFSAVEAAEKRAEDAETRAALNYGSAGRTLRAEAERDQLAAVVEKVRVRLTNDLDANDESHVSDALTILDVAPADVLREVKAAAWEEGYRHGRIDQVTLGEAVYVNPYQSPSD